VTLGVQRPDLHDVSLYWWLQLSAVTLKPTILPSLVWKLSVKVFGDVIVLLTLKLLNQSLQVGPQQQALPRGNGCLV
jgi:hypothetical protein